MSKPPSSPLALEMHLVFSHKNSILFKLLRLWAKATVCAVVLPTIFFICVPLSILVIPPLFIAFTWAFFLCKILCFLCPLRVLDIMRFFRFCTTLILGSSSSSTSKADRNDDDEDKMKELIAKSLEDKPPQAMSVVELDPSEVPCFYESDDHDHEQENSKEENGKIGMYEEEGSWQILVPKPALPKRKRDKHSV